MGQLLQQLAQTLKIPTDALQTVLSNYPKLRQEYMIYHSLYCVRMVTILIVCFAITTLFITGFLALCQIGDKEPLPKPMRKALKIETWIFVLSIFLTMLLSILMGIFAPDITIIKEIINR
jgi:hypothetical protein